jgi:hypothetical protein
MGQKWDAFRKKVSDARGILTAISLTLLIGTALGVGGVVAYQKFFGNLYEDNELRIHFIGGSREPNRRGDVVFIHGLDGHFEHTWQTDKIPPFSFPKALSQEPEFANVGFWSIKYAASSSAWYGGHMPIEDRALSILDYMRSSRIDIGSRPVIFVTHSLGGLIAKEVIVDSAYMNNPEWESVVENTSGVVFLATPHSGSSIATYLGRLEDYLKGLKLYRTTEQAKQLERNSSSLRKLGNMYKGVAKNHRLSHLSFYENENTGFTRVVDQDSADPGLTDVTTVGVDADHASICKPTAIDSPVYVKVLDFILKNLVPKVVTDDISSEKFVKLFKESSKNGKLKTLDDEYAGTAEKPAKRVTWTASVTKTVGTTDKDERPYILVQSSVDPTLIIFAEFWPNTFPTHVSPGHKVVLKGTIKSVDESGIALDDCELVQILN